MWQRGVFSFVSFPTFAALVALVARLRPASSIWREASFLLAPIPSTLAPPTFVSRLVDPRTRASESAIQVRQTR
ncbi:hypothetical protein B0H16DRAFT_528946 [Mycena metata]|uniref:Uncharacterized protein n=1 Tax=Mycena metata TaxID=1033252 RepID=A0AAD7NH83_9AGAR|nr:hypothetical protein B0H16DRAFT_528946 [Mycena metata]